MRSTRSVQSTKVGVVFLALTAMMLGLMVPASASDHLVRICHTTASESNPYTNPNVPKHKIEDEDGHGSFEAGVHPGDIIPPFAAGSLGGNSWDAYPGKNWDEQGQAIWNKGCELPGEDDGVVITIAKDWTGASYDASDVVVELTVEVDGVAYDKSPVAPGYKLTVDAGTDVEITAESVAGFAAKNQGCEFASSLPGALTYVQDDATLTVTNNVTCEVEPEDATITLVKLWLDADGEYTDARPADGWSVTATDNGNSENSVSANQPVSDGGGVEVIGINWSGWESSLVIPETGSYTVAEAGTTGWTEFECTPAQKAYVSAAFGNDIGIDQAGLGSFDPDSSSFQGHLVCNQQDAPEVVITTPVPPSTPPAEEEPEEPEVMDAVIAPTASISGECPEVGVVIEGSYELDNSASNMDVTYDVAIGDAEQVLIVEGGETYDGTFTLTPGDGEVEVVISVRDTDLVFSETFDARDCVDEPDVAVEGVVEQRPAAPVAQPVAAAPAALPKTGVSALLLTLMGLLSLGFGGALLRPRKRD